MNIEEYLRSRKRIIDENLCGYMPGERDYPEIICQAMRYSALNGGKRLRPILVLAASEAVSETWQDAIPVACAIEMIHTYSLIHDDLPCMDDDDIRRGKPTSHRKYGEAIALLAGDALLTEAFGVLLDYGKSMSVDKGTLLHILGEIVKAAGIRGMIGGQVVDVISEGKNVDFQVLSYIHAHKTGALIAACVKVGGLVGKATEEQLQALSVYGENVGVAFQIVDDLLNAVGCLEITGKAVGSDKMRKKITYPALMGVEKSRHQAHKLIQNAVTSLQDFDEEASLPLRKIAEFVLDRSY